MNKTNNKKTTNKVTKVATKRISRTAATEMIAKAGGKFFTASFVTKAGVKRTMNAIARNGCVTRLGNITVYSLRDKGIRTIDSRTMTSLRINNNSYTIV